MIHVKRMIYNCEVIRDAVKKTGWYKYADVKGPIRMKNGVQGNSADATRRLRIFPLVSYLTTSYKFTTCQWDISLWQSGKIIFVLGIYLTLNTIRDPPCPLNVEPARSAMQDNKKELNALTVHIIF